MLIYTINQVVAFYLDETEEDLYPPVVANGAPQYFGPSLEEGDNYRPGGLAEEMLGDLVRDSRTRVD